MVNHNSRSGNRNGLICFDNFANDMIGAILWWWACHRYSHWRACDEGRVIILTGWSSSWSSSCPDNCIASADVDWRQDGNRHQTEITLDRFVLIGSSAYEYNYCITIPWFTHKIWIICYPVALQPVLDKKVFAWGEGGGCVLAAIWGEYLWLALRPRRASGPDFMARSPREATARYWQNALRWHTC